MYVGGRAAGLPRRVSSTARLQTDIFKGTSPRRVDLPARPHLRLIGDLMAYTDAEMPRYKPLGVSGYRIRERRV